MEQDKGKTKILICSLSDHVHKPVKLDPSMDDEDRENTSQNSKDKIWLLISVLNFHSSLLSQIT